MNRNLNRILPFVLVGVAMLTLNSCRDTVRYLVDKWGAPPAETPKVYHALEGYAPQKQKTKGIENHERYYYYISPDPKEMYSNQQPYYYDYSEEYTPFDEEQYWKEHKLEYPEVDDAAYYQNLEIEE